LLLSLPSIPTPSSSYTNRPQWLRALLTSKAKYKGTGSPKPQQLRKNDTKSPEQVM